MQDQRLFFKLKQQQFVELLRNATKDSQAQALGTLLAGHTCLILYSEKDSECEICNCEPSQADCISACLSAKSVVLACLQISISLG